MRGVIIVFRLNIQYFIHFYPIKAGKLTGKWILTDIYLDKYYLFAFQIYQSFFSISYVFPGILMKSPSLFLKI